MKKRKLHFGLLILLCACLSGLGADKAQPALSAATTLSLQQAVELAFKNSETIAIAEETLAKHRYQRKEARGTAFPQIQGEASWGHYFEKPTINLDMGAGSTEISMVGDYEMKFGASLSQVLWAFGKIGSAIRLADKAIQMDQAAIHATQRQAETQVKVAYYTTLLAHHALQIAKESHQNAIKNRDALRSRFRLGRPQRSDNIRMEADVAARVPMLMKARSNLELAEKRLKMLIGLPEAVPVELTDPLNTDFPDFSANKLVSKLQQNDPSLKALSYAVGVNKELANVHQANHYPTLAAFVGYEYGGSSSKTFVGSGRLSHTLVAGVKLKLDIWTGGSISARHQQAIKDKRIAELRYARGRKELKLQLESAVAQYQSLVETYTANLEAQKLAEKSYEISLSRYSAGEGSQIEVSTAEAGLSRAKLDSASTLYQINIAQTKIDQWTKKGEAS